LETVAELVMVAGDAEVTTSATDADAPAARRPMSQLTDPHEPP
jgi:hypothetical protein